MRKVIKSVGRTAFQLMRLGGIDPMQLRHLRHLPRFLRERREFKRKGGSIDSNYIFLADYEDTAGIDDRHYFHQDLLVAQRIFEANPSAHVDVGSRIDGFVAHVASFRRIDVLDIRPLENNAHPQIRFAQADLMNPPEKLLGRYPSVSCLHVLEHFGLGRYSDQIDPEGHRKGFDSVAKMVAPGGTLYVSVPVGRRRVVFNAHRVVDPCDPVEWVGDQFTLAVFDYVDDRGDLHRDSVPNEARSLNYGCGIYTFTKNPEGATASVPDH